MTCTPLLAMIILGAPASDMLRTSSLNGPAALITCDARPALQPYSMSLARRPCGEYVPASIGCTA